MTTAAAVGSGGGAEPVGMGLLLLLLPLVTLPPTDSTHFSADARPRLQLSHAELRSGNVSAVFWEAGGVGAYQCMLLDEDRGWLLLGGRDHVYLLRSDNLQLPSRSIYWPASKENVERCRLAGKNYSTDCANYVRVLQPFNKTHVYTCGTGAYHPLCTYLHLGHNAEDPSFMLSHVMESGRGKCPFSPQEPFTARLTDGALYAGTSVDFMGANAAIFRTSLHGDNQHYIRTEAYQDHWLNEPQFVASFSIPDTQSLDDDKVYFFFKETAVEAGQWDKRVFSRVARVCKNDVGGKRSLIHRWTTFLKARLVCSVSGPSGVHTHFDELEDIFVLETKDPQNPVIYGVFTSSSAVFKGSAVCVYSIASIRSAFNGPFAHKEGPDYRWVEFKGRIPYPRPGTCPSETYDAQHTSTRDFPDEVVGFMRQHQLVWEQVVPVGGRPLLTHTHAPYALKKVVVDRVEAEDGHYDVLHLGTDDGRVLKVVSIVKGTTETEEIILEELSLFQNPTPILSMQLSTKRKQLYVSSVYGVVQLGVHRCGLYGSDCPSCCLARDPYCAWDGQACGAYVPTNKRRARRQDVKHGDPWSQCPLSGDGSESVELKVVYGVEGNATFLECVPRSQQTKVSWTVRNTHATHQTENHAEFSDKNQETRELSGSDEHSLHMKRGLLLPHLALPDAGEYTCSVQEHSYSRVLTRYSVHVIPHRNLNLHPSGSAPSLHQGAPARQLPVRSYKDLHLVGASGLAADEFCEQVWTREKRRQQKLRTLKLKQAAAENRKARVRRHDPSPSTL